MVPVVLILIAENTGHVKAVAEMTGESLDASLGRAYMGDGLATMVAGFFGGSGTTTYAENIGVMAATKVYSTAAYIVAALFAILLGLCPKFGALILTMPLSVLGGVTTILYGLIAVLGARIWVESKVDFRLNNNLMPAAIALIVGAGDFTFVFSKDVSFGGIALGTVAVLVAYHLMAWLEAMGRGAGGLSAFWGLGEVGLTDAAADAASCRRSEIKARRAGHRLAARRDNSDNAPRRRAAATGASEQTGDAQCP